MEPDRDVERKDLERKPEEQGTEQQRQGHDAEPSEHVTERAPGLEGGAERHAGEDPGATPPPHDPDRGEPE